MTILLSINSACIGDTVRAQVCFERREDKEKASLYRLAFWRRHPDLILRNEVVPDQSNGNKV